MCGEAANGRWIIVLYFMRFCCVSAELLFGPPAQMVYCGWLPVLYLCMSDTRVKTCTRTVRRTS